MHPNYLPLRRGLAHRHTHRANRPVGQPWYQPGVVHYAAWQPCRHWAHLVPPPEPGWMACYTIHTQPPYQTTSTHKTHTHTPHSHHTVTTAFAPATCQGATNPWNHACLTHCDMTHHVHSHSHTDTPHTPATCLTHFGVRPHAPHSSNDGWQLRRQRRPTSRTPKHTPTNLTRLLRPDAHIHTRLTHQHIACNANTAASCTLTHHMCVQGVQQHNTYTDTQRGAHTAAPAGWGRAVLPRRPMRDSNRGGATAAHM
jgi:hypothetical protein